VLVYHHHHNEENNDENDITSEKKKLKVVLSPLDGLLADDLNTPTIDDNNNRISHSEQGQL
jgi:hypothetical protein